MAPSPWDPHSLLLLTAAVTVVYQLSFFIIAAAFRIDKVTDFAGTTNFVVLALLGLLLNGTFTQRQVLLTSLVVIWGARLAAFLLIRIMIWGEDRRFDNTRNDMVKFAVFWAFQAVWVWVVSLPVTIVNGTSDPIPLGTAGVVGALLWALGFGIETVADLQKLQVKRGLEVSSATSPGSRVPWCHVGVWKWSRHPNYFGEILLWTGVLVASAPELRGWQWLAVLSPLFTAYILLFLSGIPLLEASANEKYGARSDYQEYKKKTSILVPVPPQLYGPLPKWLKSWVLLDLPLYSTLQRSKLD